jgi:hypothetical protein
MRSWMNVKIKANILLYFRHIIKISSIRYKANQSFRLFPETKPWIIAIIRDRTPPLGRSTIQQLPGVMAASLRCEHSMRFLV